MEAQHEISACYGFSGAEDKAIGAKEYAVPGLVFIAVMLIKHQTHQAGARPIRSKRLAPE
ncbi:hypothetical protein [Oceanisphaera psychrotolerans]|uniref:Uncharacterized protein n=1 Tax=Oceanisphaera psychrotolerans TaxID=1414654 RepID=A0A1J4QDL8_9GAMM|nr:hypothetical protein [Oceanisphaera psychrotolerans]OIN05607.1 hypothetical protein BFR47_05320 [Oceanisphaera psychrotolerans]